MRVQTKTAVFAILATILTHPGIVLAQYSLGQVPAEEPGSGTPPTPVPEVPRAADDSRATAESERNTMLVDERSVSEVLKIASQNADFGSGRMVLNLQLSSTPSAHESEQLKGADSRKALSEFREREFRKTFGDRTIYDPNYPTKGEVFSISVAPARLKELVKKAANDFPQVSHIWASYQQYELVQIDKLPAYPVVTTVPLKNTVFIDALKTAGMELLGSPRGGKVQVIVSNEAQAAWLEKNSSPPTRRGPTGFEPPIAVRTFGDSHLEEPKSVVDREKEPKSVHELVATHYVWLIGRPVDEVEKDLKKHGAQVTEKSRRRIAFHATKRQVEELEKAGVDLFAMQ